MAGVTAPDPAHGHGHGDLGGWDIWVGHPSLRWLLVGLAAAGLLTILGVVRFWPDGAGRAAAIAEAQEIGLATERIQATVESVTDGPCSYSTADNPQDCRLVIAALDAAGRQGELVALPEFNFGIASTPPDVAPGDRVILGYEPTTDFFFYADLERRTPLLWLTAAFVVVVLALGRLRGAMALSAMAITIAVLVGFVSPSVLDGNDPVAVSVVAASAIAFVSLYLTHGFSPTTTVALAGTLVSLGLTLAVSGLFFDLSRFTGLATEEGLTIPVIADDINLASLLLGGAILGALGALDDVTVTQVATVAELHDRNPRLGRAELIASGIRVGREHIASTVNTLLLAYAGASMPLLLLFSVSEQSLGMIANSELIAVEIVRTLAGSIGLVAAVPITTTLAATLVAGSAVPALAADETPMAGRSGPATPPDRDDLNHRPAWSDFAAPDEFDL